MINVYNNLFKYYSETVVNEKPDWISEYKEIESDLSYRLLKFNSGGDEEKIPVLVVPPQAGHHSSIADFGSREQSLVHTSGKATGAPVYAIEWKSSVQKYETIDDLVLYLDVCVNAAGGKVHLIGLCQGGWLSALYASLFPEKVASLLLGAAPIDFKAGESKLKSFVDKIPMEGYRMLVKAGGGYLRGDIMLRGWKLTSPYERYIEDYLNLWRNIENDRLLERSRKFRVWYEYTQHISGRWYLQAVEDLFKKNRLVKGTLRVLHRNVDLGNIKCPVAMLAGEKDDITPVPQVYALGDYVSTSEKDRFFRVIPESGHIGVFMRTKSQEHWADALRFVQEHGEVYLHLKETEAA